MDSNQPPVAASVAADTAAAVAASQPSGDELLDLADELTYRLDAIAYLNVVKIRPTDDPGRRLMGTSFCPRLKDSEAVLEDLLDALGGTLDGRPVRSAGFTVQDQAYVDFVIGEGEGAVTGRIRVTVYG